MGTSANENIAIAIESSANTDAIRGARDDVSSLGRAAKQATQDVAAGYELASTNVDKFGQALVRHEEGVERTRGAARGLALEFSHLAFAAVEGEGSALGLARASGLLATELAEMSGSAELALSASALGGIVTVAATLIALFSDASSETDKLKGSLDNLAGLNSDQLAIQEQAVRAYLDGVNRQIEANDTAMRSTAATIAKQGSLLGAAQAAAVTVGINRENGKLLALQQDLENRLLEIHGHRIEAEKHEDEQAARDREAREREEERIARENAQKAASLDATMSEERQAALDKVALSEEDTAIQRAVREEQRREQEIRDLQISEDEKTRLILEAQATRDAQIGAIHKAAVDKQAADDKRAADEAKRAADAQRDAQIRSLESVMDASIRSGESYMQTVTKTLLTPLEKKLEAVAAEQVVDAAADAAALNFAGAAAHAGAAALAIEGARKVAQIGGLNASGGGGLSGGAGSGAGSDASLSPREGQGTGPIVVNLLTTNPYSRENIAIASYELSRAGKLNRPIYVPPTNGLAPAGA